MSRFENKRKEKFVSDRITTSIEAVEDTLTARCKFNFAYFDVQDAGQSFDDWTQDQLARLLNKLKDFSRESLRHWQQAHVLQIYGAFPQRTDFTHPKHVPHQARWGRFRLEGAVRLVGFVLPQDCHGKEHAGTKERFDCNTFYVVFLDANHRFYITER